MVYVTRFNRTILAPGAKRNEPPPSTLLREGGLRLSQGWVPITMCRCLSNAVQFWIGWSSWLVKLVVVSWAVTFVTDLLLAFFWSFLTELLREFLKSFWASYSPSGGSHGVAL